MSEAATTTDIDRAVEQARRRVTRPTQHRQPPLMTYGRLLVLLAGAIACAVTGFWLWNITHPSPVDTARSLSGLQVPAEARILVFRDETSGFMDQDFYLRIELEVPAADIARLTSEARREGFVVTPPPDQACIERDIGGVGEAGRCKARANVGTIPGLFRYRAGPGFHELVVLDSARRRLIVQQLKI